MASSESMYVHINIYYIRNVICKQNNEAEQITNDPNIANKGHY
jgi:hypothetical protein